MDVSLTVSAPGSLLGMSSWDIKKYVYPKRKEKEFKDSVQFLASMGLPASMLSVTRKDVESGKARFANETERRMYSRFDGPADTLATDSKYYEGQNPVVSRDSPANK